MPGHFLGNTKEILDMNIGLSYTQGTYHLVKDKTYISHIKKKGRGCKDSGQ